MILLEIAPRTEDADDLVHKLRRYWEWGRPLAPDADKHTVNLVRSRPDAIASIRGSAPANSRAAPTSLAWTARRQLKGTAGPCLLNRSEVTTVKGGETGNFVADRHAYCHTLLLGGVLGRLG